MAILSRPKFSPQQRLDLEDINALLSAIRTDSKLWTKQFLSSENYILKGFSVSGIGLNQATVAVTDATLIVPENSTDFSWFTSAPGDSDITVTDSELTDNTRNFLELALFTQDGTPLQKALWDPEANSGDGAEFNQLINTITDLVVQVVVSTGGFSGSVDRLPLAIIDTDVTGSIKTILDRRELFFRGALPNDLDNEYSWGSKVEPTYSLVMTGVSGTFQADEQITIGTETATVVTGGTTSITFNVPTGVNFFPGDSVTGGTSGATGTIDTVLESFAGVDKSIDSFREVLLAIYTEIKNIKGTRFWWQDASPSLVGLMQNFDAVLVQDALDASWSWDGTELSITDDDGSPADADSLALLRRFGETTDLSLTRQDGSGGSVTIPINDGQVLFIKLPDLGTARTFTGVGSSDTNYQVVDIGDYESSDGNYWLAYREGSMLYVRGYGEMETGESTPITDPDKETILSLINANASSANQDRQLKMIEGGTINVTDNSGTYELFLGSDAYISVPGLTNDRNTISAQNISLPNANSAAYVDIERTAGGANVLSVTVADIDAIADDPDRVIIARRVSDGIMVGAPAAFLIKPGEYLEMDGALAEINRYFGQLRMTAEAGDKKVNISGVDITKLSGAGLAQVLSNLLLDFSGAQIDFTTGVITKEDGITPLGINFTPPTVAASQWRWLSVTLLPSTLTADNKITGNLLVLPADADGASKAAAPKAPFSSGGIPLGQFAIQRNAGDTDFENIVDDDILQIGIGSGSGGSGSGDANSFVETIKNMLNDSIFRSATPYVASQDQEDTDFIDASSTGSYAIVDESFELESIGDTLVSANLLDSEFLAGDKSIDQIELLLKWNENGLDTGATYEVSRNGGNEWQTISMDRIADTFSYRGYHTFDDEAVNQILASQVSTNSTQPFNDTTEQFLAQEITLANLSVIRSIDIDFTVVGSPVGNLEVQIIKDDTSFPSTDAQDIEYISTSIDASTLATGTTTVDLNAVLPAGTYHIVIKTDDTYQLEYGNSAGANRVEWDIFIGGTGLATFNGTVWANPGTGSSAGFVLSGIELDLRLRVTGSVNNALISAFGVLYEKSIGDLAYATVVDGITKVSFQAVADNENEFVLPFLPNPDLLVVHLLGSGQSFRFGDFTLQGNTVIFEEDQFNNGGVEKEQTLIFDQLKGGAFDNSDVNGSLLAANFLGSTDATIDKSQNGRGPNMKSPDGTRYEIVVQDGGTGIDIYEVT